LFSHSTRCRRVPVVLSKPVNAQKCSCTQVRLLFKKEFCNRCSTSRTSQSRLNGLREVKSAAKGRMVLWKRQSFDGSNRQCQTFDSCGEMFSGEASSLQFGPVEMATLEQGDGQFKNPCLTSVEGKLFAAIWHGTSGAEPVLIGCDTPSGSLLNDNPSSTAGTGHARAQNPIGHGNNYRATKRAQPKRHPSMLSRASANHHRSKDGPIKHQRTPKVNSFSNRCATVRTRGSLLEMWHTIGTLPCPEPQ